MEKGTGHSPIAVIDAVKTRFACAQEDGQDHFTFLCLGILRGKAVKRRLHSALLGDRLFSSRGGARNEKRLTTSEP